MNDARSRGTCPTIARPMEAGDGWLARLPHREEPLTAVQVLGIAAAGRRFGNGIIEVTARGTVQVRGLSPESIGDFSGALADLGIADLGPAVVSGPLAGLDPAEIIDVRPVVRRLRAALAETGLAERLAPKVSVVVNGGGALSLDGLDADLRMVADPRRGGIFDLALGGDGATAISLGAFAQASAVEAAVAVLAMIADRGRSARGRDLRADARPSPPVPTGQAVSLQRAEATGVHTLRGARFAVGVGLPFAQTDVDTLMALVGLAMDCGAESFAPAPGRVLLAIGMGEEAAAAFRDHASILGFITQPDDPRGWVSACAGAPACASGRMPARAIAAEAAAAAAPMLDGSVAIHISGCAKGCAHPRAATLTFVGTEAGIGVVIGGRAGDPPGTVIAPGSIPARLREVSRAVAAAKRHGEPAGDTIARIGLEQAVPPRRERVDA